jgi:hypothetical protein
VNAFDGCKNLTTINLQNLPSLQAIGEAAFSGCEKLERVILPNGIKKIEDGTFMSCHSLIEIIGANVESEAEFSFYDCPKLKTKKFAK